MTDGPGEVRKLGGVLGETDGLGTADPRVVVGLGINADWAAADFPPELAATMTSLREVAGRRIERDDLLDAFVDVRSSRASRPSATGRFDGAALGRPPGDDRPDGPARDGRTGPRRFARSASTR